MQKAVIGVYPGPQAHWVGDGFPVRSLFTYDKLGPRISPFLLLDYAAPTLFTPALKPRGVGEHPHRGFETVTIVYQGEVAHRDSAGNSGVIGPGDVQWMSAASGVLHDEFHSPSFMRRGGAMEMAQLWVNLPAKHKMSPPRYQSLQSGDIPRLELTGGAGTVRVIAGNFAGHSGPAATCTALNVWDVELQAGLETTLSVPEGHAAAVAVLRGAATVNGGTQARDCELVLLDRAGSDIQIQAKTAAKLLLLSGEPIEEPIVGYGPFVMNTRQEIETAMLDFRMGKFGRLAAAG